MPHIKKQRGLGLKASDVKQLLDRSYSKGKPTDYDDFIVDSSLSDNDIQVYKNRNSDQVVVVHRGTEGLTDWMSNYSDFMGNNTSRLIKAGKI